MDKKTIIIFTIALLLVTASMALTFEVAPIDKKIIDNEKTTILTEKLAETSLTKEQYAIKMLDIQIETEYIQNLKDKIKSELSMFDTDAGKLYSFVLLCTKEDVRDINIEEIDTQIPKMLDTIDRVLNQHDSDIEYLKNTISCMETNLKR